MKIELYLSNAAEYAAFGEFCVKAAIAKEAQEAEHRDLMKALPQSVNNYGAAVARLQTMQCGQAPCDANGAPWTDVTDQVQEKMAQVQTLATAEMEKAAAAEKPKATRTRATKAKVEPKAEPETAETIAQDDEDEKAETETVTTLSHDSVRAVLGKYVDRFGMECAQADGPVVISKLFGEGKTKITDIPDDQEAFKKVIAGVEEMLTKNPFNRKEVA